MELNAPIRFEEDFYWAHVDELPGCFASGGTLDELREALTEAVALYLEEALERVTVRLDEMKLLVCT